MPNRYKREGWLRSRKLAIASAEAEVLCGRLMLAVDDFGRMNADPVIVRATCFPKSFNRYTDEQVAAWLEELDCCLHLIVRYQVGHDHILQLLNTDKPRAKFSKYPPPPQACEREIERRSVDGPPESCPHRSGSMGSAHADSVCAMSTACEQPARSVLTACSQPVDSVRALYEDGLRSSSSVPDSKTEEQKAKAPPPDGGSALDADFEQFWGQYPHPANDHRKPALLKYRAARRRGVSQAELLEAVEYEAQLRARAGETGAFFPAVAHSKTWLGQERWIGLLAMKRDQGAAATRAAADRERLVAEARTKRLSFVSELRRRAPELYQQRVKNLMSDERDALEAELDEFDRSGDAASPSGQQAAGGSA